MQTKRRERVTVANESVRRRGVPGHRIYKELGGAAEDEPDGERRSFGFWHGETQLIGFCHGSATVA